MGFPTLDSEDFGQRLYALARAGPCELLEWQPRWAELPLLPLVWRLRQLQLTDPGCLPGRLSRNWLRWQRPHRPHSLQACLRGLLRADSWEARLTWLWLLLEHHPQSAIDELISLLRHSQPEIAEVAALGLGLSGRQILPEVRDRWTCAGQSERDAICHCLWYLGPQARGCLNWLGIQQRPWAKALYYAMEQHGWSALLELGDSPIWLDHDSLEALAGLVFAVRAQDRRRALQPLRGWGPAAHRGFVLLEFLAEDEDPEISQRALQELLVASQGLPPELLQRGLLATNPELQALACRALIRSQVGPQRLEFEDLQRTSIRQRVLLRSRQCWPAPWAERVLTHLSQHAESDPDLARELLEPELDRLALHVYLRLEGSISEALRRSPAEISRLLLVELMSRLRWQEVVDSLVSSHMLEVFAEEYGMLRLLDARQFGLLSLLEERLRFHLCNPDAELVRAARRLLAQVDFSCVRWEQWPRLRCQQTDTLLILMEWRGRFPKELVQPIREGRLSHRPLLKALIRTHPEAESILLDCLDHCPPGERAHIRESLEHFGVTSWLEMLDSLAEAGESWQHFSQELFSVRGSQRLSFLLDQDPESLPQTPSAALAQALAESLLHVGTPLDERRLSWARCLARLPEAGHCPIYYLLRAGQPGLEAVLELFQHPDARIRYAAIVCTRFAYPDWAWLYRSLPPDPDPENRLRMLEHLHYKVGLNQDERESLKELREIPQTRYGASVLLEGGVGSDRRREDA